MLYCRCWMQARHARLAWASKDPAFTSAPARGGVDKLKSPTGSKRFMIIRDTRDTTIRLSFEHRPSDIRELFYEKMR